MDFDQAAPGTNLRGRRLVGDEDVPSWLRPLVANVHDRGTAGAGCTTWSGRRRPRRAAGPC